MVCIQVCPKTLCLHVHIIDTINRKTAIKHMSYVISFYACGENVIKTCSSYVRT